MPRGVPRLGSRMDELVSTPGAVDLGSISETKLDSPDPSFSGWTGTDGSTINIEDAPPPWEADPRWLHDNSNARRFVDVPDSWGLRWLNPRRIDNAGFRGWTPLSAEDSEITFKVPSMRSPENYIRRGGMNGDILCMMPIHWVESRNREKAREVAIKTQSSVDRQGLVAQEVNRSSVGLIHVDSTTHPTFTIVEGRDLDKTR